MKKCQTCGGTYERDQADGTLYFHACPPLSVREIKDAIAAGASPLSAKQRAQYDAAIVADQAITAKGGTATVVDAVLAGVSIPRPLHRDENIAIPAIEKRPAVLVAVGKGEPVDVP